MLSSRRGIVREMDGGDDWGTPVGAALVALIVGMAVTAVFLGLSSLWVALVSAALSALVGYAAFKIKNG
jgi:hypothetical protein